MENSNLLPENEVTEFENRLYLNPQVGVDETNTFIDKFRDTQRGNTQEIAQQTGMLGTDVPSSLGGLTGAGNYFTSRYQTPQTNAVVQNLRTAAQATALNEVLANEQAMWKKRYNDTYKAYQRRQNRKANSGGRGGNTGGNGDNTSTWNGEVDEEVTEPQNFYGVPGATMTEDDTHYIYTDPKTGEQVKVSKDYMNKLYDENGSLTDEGMVILDTRRMLGL